MPYSTDERLKGYLDTDQMRREQMCLAVMAIDKRFSDVRPRHPRGGRDGARDIEAVFNGLQRAFGAVGFINQATDSGADKRSAKKKFNTDLREALKQEPQPEVFVFFTNVNLTQKEKDNLVGGAKTTGLAHAEIFDRERIRLSLDNPDGLSIRFQYLDLPLSVAEQATFFARWGDDIQGVISNGFSRLQTSLNRILFLHEAQLPLSHFSVSFELDREYTGSEIGHFRAFAWVHLKGLSQGLLSFTFGATDNETRLDATTPEQLAQGKTGMGASQCGGQWEIRESDDQANGDRSTKKRLDYSYKRAGNFRSVGQERVRSVYIRYSHNSLLRYMPMPSLLDIDESMFLFELNQRLAEKVRTIRIFANQYQLWEISDAGFRVEQSVPKPAVPLFFSDEELADSWVRLRPRDGTSTFHFRFSEQTPKRFFHAEELTQSRIQAL